MKTDRLKTDQKLSIIWSSALWSVYFKKLAGTVEQFKLKGTCGLKIQQNLLTVHPLSVQSRLKYDFGSVSLPRKASEDFHFLPITCVQILLECAVFIWTDYNLQPGNSVQKISLYWLWIASVLASSQIYDHTFWNRKTSFQKTVWRIAS